MAWAISSALPRIAVRKRCFVAITRAMAYTIEARLSLHSFSRPLAIRSWGCRSRDQEPVRSRNLPEDQSDMSFDFQPILKGTLLQLRPLRAEDFRALYAVAADPLIW